MRRTRDCLGGTRTGFKFGRTAMIAVSALAVLGFAPPVAADEVPAPAASEALEVAAESVHQPLELGVFLGALFPSTHQQALRDARKISPGESNSFEGVAPEFGLRFAFLPVPYIGVEGDAAVMPASGLRRAAKGGDVLETDAATVFALRGHLLLQYPTRVLTPFILGGAGRHWVRGGNVLGRDDDLTWHFGGGFKLPLDKHLLARVDIRDTVVPGQQSGDGTFKDPTTHWAELLLGLTYAFGGSEPLPPPPAPVDSDHDGLTDDVDKCPVAPANTPDGCPIPDTDGDGVLDNVDACPTEKGALANGCPDLDPDKDGVPVPADVCPGEAGIAPDGCPDKDSDKDGVLLPDDKCPEALETKNGYEDTDGCPDEVPEVVKKFTGVVKGINFDLGKASIRKDSFALLDQAAAVLTEHASLKMEISGHTDNVGKEDKNRELSQARADSVRAYLITKGIDGERLIARGAGPSEPVADNKTKAGQAQNRRIEFKILQ